jgi:hypothetical protein
MSLDINLTNVESTTNKKTTLTDNSDTFYPTQKAVKTAVDAKENTITAGTTAQYFRGDKTFQTLDKTAVGLSNVDNTSDANKPVSTATQTALNAKFNTPTGTTAQYLRGDGSLETFPTIPDPSDFVEKSDFTSHSILAKQSGASDPVAVSIGNNEILGRKSGGGSNIEGLSVSEVKSLLNYTASDVGAPSGSGSSTGTNTGDETQASILSKLGIWNIQDQTAGTASSGTTLTITKSIALPSVPSFLNFRAVFFKTGINGAYTVRAYLSEVDNNIGGTAIQIAVVTGANAAVNNLPMKRTFDIIGGNIIGLQAGNSQVTDDINSSSVRLNTPIPTGTPLYLIFTVQCVNASDSARFESAQINNFSF